ncbi:MAG: ABC transporter ATP-binding protein [Chloroflexales bacterium]|nr:ABC transporter ATP-binding protein [Chloroflexales bacterium]
MRSEIIVDKVSLQYYNGNETIPALADISFRIALGEFCAILGPSGCGKSTMINLIAGFITATSGFITVNGAPVSAPGPDRVVVAQDYSLFLWKTVRANVEFGLKARGLRAGERRAMAQKYLDLVHLIPFADNYPLELSGGMRQRVALARALAVEPACLLMDEPLAALDMQMRHYLQDELLAIWTQTRQTILLVTHDLDEALYLADCILVMAARPGHIRATFTVPFPRPRSPDLRLTDGFQALKREVAMSLYAAVAG